MTATALDRTETPVWLRVGEIALAALVYFALARASLYFASLNASVTPRWPPTGLAIALLLLRGNVLLPAIAIGAFAANYAVTPQIATAGIIAIGNTLEAFIVTFLVQRWAKGEHVFQSPIGVGKFAVIVTAGASASWTDLALYLVARDPRVPWYARLFVAAVAAYALSPIDLIPDFIPVLGYLDEVILLPGLLWLVVRLMPDGVMRDARTQADDWFAQRRGKPRSIAGAVLIVAIWLAVLGLAAGAWWAR